MSSTSFNSTPSASGTSTPAADRSSFATQGSGSGVGGGAVMSSSDGGSEATMAQVIQALNILYQDPDPLAKEKANSWLSDFQKSNEAWSTAQLILSAPQAPVQVKLFSAQTFRSKITFDLERLPIDSRLFLRETILTALRQPGLERVVQTQLCIALADLALQCTNEEWATPYPSSLDHGDATKMAANGAGSHSGKVISEGDPARWMILQLGQDPNMAGVLLEFLKVLVEEFTDNLKFQVKNEFGRLGNDVEHGNSPNEVENGKGAPVRGEEIAALLSMYVQAPGITFRLHNQCFSTLSSWLRTGQITATSLGGSPILASTFNSLQDDALFDNAVDVLVDLIHETQELNENVSIIQELVPRLSGLRTLLNDPATRDDEDKMRGYCRILVEAGEWYEPLILAHPQSFLDLVRGIADCFTYAENLEIVGITFHFWYKLGRSLRRMRLGQKPPDQVEFYQPYLDIYSELVGVIIKHLHYPLDESNLVGEERDAFRDFRHSIGDTLKDCCGVLGTTACLKRSHDLITSVLLSAERGGQVHWQDIEAPLFSMRSMGAEVDPRDEEIIPQIMSLIPKLPSHPKIRYAAILVIGRYAEWINYHPEHIQFQLSYISSGFTEEGAANTPEVSAAAAQAMKFLCKDCSEHLVPFLPDLHQFVQSVSGKLGPEDLLDLSAAIAHIITVMSPGEIPRALSTFCMPNIEFIHALTSRPENASKAELRLACDALERLDTLLRIVEGFPSNGGVGEEGAIGGGSLPLECRDTPAQVWVVLDAFLARYGAVPQVAEKTCGTIRMGLIFFGDAAFPVATPVVRRLSANFEISPASCYLWITGKMVEAFSRMGDELFHETVKDAVGRESIKVFEILQRTEPAQIPDILDDYTHLVYDLVEYAPDVLFLSSSFPATFQSLLSTLSLLAPQIVLSALDAVRSIVGHEALQYDPSQPGLPPSYSNFPAYAQVIRQTIQATAPALVKILVHGVVDGVIEDMATSSLTVLRLLSLQFPAELLTNVPVAIEGIDSKLASLAEKQEFLHKFNQAMSNRNPNQTKDAFTWLMRTSRKSKERVRVLEDRR